jgi:HPt (histidine-containing phosphotransfer) domain-containing protein
LASQAALLRPTSPEATPQRDPLARDPLARDPSADASCPIDLIHLARQTMGDGDLETELLGLFERQATQIVERLAADFPTGGVAWRADLAHTLRGSARAIGATRVAIKAEIYEVQARDGKPDLKPALAGLTKAVEQACAAISDLLRN